MALPKAHRLRRRQEFDTVYRRGRRHHASHLLLRVVLNRKSTSDSPEPIRVAVVVSQKVHKRAVIRNRIRRQILAGFQTLLPRLSPGILLVITVKPAALECDYHKFLQELEQLLAKAEVLNGHS